MSLRLAKAGFGGGDPEKVSRMKVGWVTAALQYEIYSAEYERKYIELNKGRE